LLRCFADIWMEQLSPHRQLAIVLQALRRTSSVILQHVKMRRGRKDGYMLSVFKQEKGQYCLREKFGE